MMENFDHNMQLCNRKGPDVERRTQAVSGPLLGHLLKSFGRMKPVVSVMEENCFIQHNKLEYEEILSSLNSISHNLKF